MPVNYDARHPAPTFPGEKAVSITKSDSTVFAATRGLYVGVTGDLVVLFAGDTATVTLKNVAAGVTHPWSVTKVMAATTATDIVGIY